jgi:hypothetical protein
MRTRRVRCALRRLEIFANQDRPARLAAADARLATADDLATERGGLVGRRALVPPLVAGLVVDGFVGVVLRVVGGHEMRALVDEPQVHQLAHRGAGRAGATAEHAGHVGVLDDAPALASESALGGEQPRQGVNRARRSGLPERVAHVSQLVRSCPALLGAVRYEAPRGALAAPATPLGAVALEGAAAGQSFVFPSIGWDGKTRARSPRDVTLRHRW